MPSSPSRGRVRSGPARGPSRGLDRQTGNQPAATMTQAGQAGKGNPVEEATESAQSDQSMSISRGRKDLPGEPRERNEPARVEVRRDAGCSRSPAHGFDPRPSMP